MLVQFRTVIVTCVLAHLGLPAAFAAPLTVLGEIGAPARYGLECLGKATELTEAESPRDGGLVVGTHAGSTRIREWVQAGSLALPEAAESLAVKRMALQGASVWVVAGRDDTGLMYALLDLADALHHAPAGTNWQDVIRETTEQPANRMRRLRLLLHHKENEEMWYYDREFWDWYLNLLATNRWNGLNLVFSHQTSYMAPMYAWHVVVEKYPHVRGKGVSDQDMRRNLETLRFIVSECNRRGIEFTLGVWQQLPWIEEFLGGRSDQPVYVEGLNAENAAEYSRLAVAKLLEEVPGIARFQLRPNDESGIPGPMQTDFWRDNVIRPLKEANPPVKLDLRTVGVRQSTVDMAREEMGRDVRISMKFYGEHLGMPFPPMDVVTTNYSYDRFLKHPFPNDFYSEVWMLGSHCVLLWGSEEYGRQFGRMASYAGTIGFEHDTHMAQKGYMDPYSKGWRMFENPEDEYYRWEQERYWAFYRCIGRFSYDPEAPREIWLRPFRARFGAAAETVARAYDEASKVVNLVVASHLNDINMYVWAEKNMGGVLGAYIDINGSDKVMFPSIREEVEEELAGRRSGGYMGAMKLAEEYERIADRTLRALDEMRREIPEPGKEERATLNDFTLLVHLARYHAHRQREAYHMERFYRTSDASLLPDAKTSSQEAVREWARVVEISDPVYYDHMLYGPIENGHWKDSQFIVETNPKLVEEAEELFRAFGCFDYGFDFGGEPMATPIYVFSVRNYQNEYDMQPRFTGVYPAFRYHVGFGYGFVENEGLGALRYPRVPHGMLRGAYPEPDQPLPVEALLRDAVRGERPFAFHLDLPKMDRYRFSFIFSDRSARPRDRGPFHVQALGRSARDRWNLIENIRVPAGETVVRNLDRNIRNSWYAYFRFGLAPAREGADAILSGLTAHRMAPNLAHAPRLRLDPARPRLAVTITMPPEFRDGAAMPSADCLGRLREAHVTWRHGWRGPWTRTPLQSRDGFVYEAELPAMQGGMVQYYFEAVDHEGNVSSCPEQAGLFRAPLTADNDPPVVEHALVERWNAGEDIPIRARVADESGIQWVRVRFRHLNEYHPYQSVELRREGEEYVGVIPREAMREGYDMVYYLEACDEAGNATFYPDWRQRAPYQIVRLDH